MGTLGRAIYTVGFWIRETGQAVDRLGSRLQGSYYFKEQLSRHRTLMNIFDKAPVVDKDAFVAPSASVIGDVQVGKGSSIWYGCVLRGDVNNIVIGAGTNIQDNSLVHVAKSNLSGKVLPTIIGDNVTVGHSAVVHGCTVEDEAFVGMGATLLDGVVVEKHAMVAAGALVRQNTRIPSGEVWAGNPAKFLRKLTDEEIAFISQSATNYVNLAQVHAAENGKSFDEIEFEKVLRKKFARRDEEYDSMLGAEKALRTMARVSLSLLVAMFVVLWWWEVKAEYVKYKDPNQQPAARVADLVARMTLQEKIGQMVQIDRSVANFDTMKTYFIGSVLSGGGSAPLPEASAEDWVNMINGFQKGSLASRLGIPMIYGIDAVHGHNNVYNATIFPHNIGLGATRDPELAKRIGSATALEVRATGIPYAFAPCIAVCRDPRWGRCYESYSEDHRIVQAMTEIIPGLQGDIPANSRKGFPYVGGNKKVAACAKHFVGDGGTIRGINENNTITDRHDLLSIHMPAYSDSIIKGVSTVMISYSSWNGEKMHANRDLVTGFLKDTLKFKGFVISDWEGIDRITSPPHSNYTYSVQASILAGIDMVMVPVNYKEFINDLTYLVKNNVIPMDRIDDAVGRILLVKFTMGLFENPFGDLSLVNELGSQAHRDLAREAVRKSLVLLKNGKNGTIPVLPLPKKVPKILVAGSHADNLGYQCGGWTMAWQGFSGNNKTRGTTILGAIKSTVDSSTEVVYLENPDSDSVKSNNFEYAIVVVGEHPYAETDGDSMNLTMADPGPSVITSVCEAVKCIVIIISGRPVVIEPYVSSIDALVAAWLPGTEGQGITDVLYGEHGFSGKLPRTWFRSVDQLPMNIGDPHYDPLFPFGFGLETESVKELVTRSTSADVFRRPWTFLVAVALIISLRLEFP